MEQNLPSISYNPSVDEEKETELEKLVTEESPVPEEFYEIDGDNSESSLVRISREPKKQVVKNEGTMAKIKKICLFQVFGFKGTLIHVVALYLFMLGLLGGLTGTTMDICIDQISKLKNWLLLLFDASYYKIIVWILFTICGGTCAFLFTKYVSPTANGSGVPEMKVTLLGNHFPNFLTMRTLIAKVIGLIFAIGSGLWCGKVGPSIHICSCIAAQLAHLPFFHFIRENKELFVHMLAIASGCGVASTFGCPIGGLLFSVEVTATYYPVRNYWFAIFTSVISAFTFRAVTNIYKGRDGLFTGVMAISYTFEPPGIKEAIIALIIGIICGVFAILFTNATGTIFVTRAYLRKFYLGRIPYLYFIIFATLTGVVTAPWKNKYNGFGYSVNVTLGYLFGNKSIEPVFGPHYITVLAVYFVARFTITAFSISLPVPVGLFSTNVVVGAVLGRLIGEIINELGIYNNLGPGGIAIIGGACFVASITQTFSATVVILESIDNNQLLLPILLATVVTISLSRFFTEGIYDKIAISKKLPFIPDIQYSIHQTAEMVMDENMFPVSEFTTIEDLKDITEHYNTLKEKIIPVINSKEGGILLGQIKLSSIRKVLDSQLSNKLNGKFLLNYKECPLLLLRHTPLSEVHMLFIAAQVESAFVTSNGRLVGEINKKCLNDAFNKQMKILF
ncbi:hypothetical protein ENUP19_0378G0016 [Entamoeba nuttalli]|uniref:Chloride channel protein 2, putative n=2 Tax=Entamoeba nuttalli TaxID=412467 RepID=K2HXJ0_ENTNP|nr:chloride channel protein 2, putative [Entamoeba nuttalli P19]EKE41060.1 chloride channel protein 2, putative [Entamoeba nuttalli P19]|eukprot:XP_008856612.1 chloride channel protein 2, putative [Entamoeba nuttalli P19]